MGTKEQIDKVLPKKVILIGVGGASCSGKTTLAKHLRSVLRGSFIVHQDDFAPPEELIPMHPVHPVQDWDDPEGAIDWLRLASFLQQVKTEGVIPTSHISHDALNKQTEVPIDKEVLLKWTSIFDDMKGKAREEGVELVWGLVDGFLLYWHPGVIHELDVRLFLRVSYETLKERRNNRTGYYTAVQSSPEGSFWQDPPEYWDNIVWPAYVKAHERIFEGGDVDRGKLIIPKEEDHQGVAEKNTALNGVQHTPHGKPSPVPAEDCGQPVSDLIVMPAERITMTELFEAACKSIQESSVSSTGGK
ncbi:P-loop containing nucleoside triphosphate hydrolase protein [Serendipita vermifera]|nr:P-loop containing nucleoside triphosphate hydrolase protein [Serendipita vermifera]